MPAVAVALDGVDPLLYATKKAIGPSRQAVDIYIADLRAAAGVETDIKIFRRHSLGFAYHRIAKIMGVDQNTIHNHLSIMRRLAFLLNTDL